MTEILFEKTCNGFKRKVLVIGFRGGDLKIKIKAWPFLNFNIKEMKTYEHVFNLEEYLFIKKLIDENYQQENQEVLTCQ